MTRTPMGPNMIISGESKVDSTAVPWDVCEEYERKKSATLRTVFQYEWPASERGLEPAFISHTLFSCHHKLFPSKEDVESFLKLSVENRVLTEYTNESEKDRKVWRLTTPLTQAELAGFWQYRANLSRKRKKVMDHKLDRKVLSIDTTFTQSGRVEGRAERSKVESDSSADRPIKLHRWLDPPDVARIKAQLLTKAADPSYATQIISPFQTYKSFDKLDLRAANGDSSFLAKRWEPPRSPQGCSTVTGCISRAAQYDDKQRSTNGKVLKNSVIIDSCEELSFRDFPLSTNVLAPDLLRNRSSSSISGGTILSLDSDSKGLLSKIHPRIVHPSVPVKTLEAPDVEPTGNGTVDRKRDPSAFHPVYIKNVKVNLMDLTSAAKPILDCSPVGVETVSSNITPEQVAAAIDTATQLGVPTESSGCCAKFQDSDQLTQSFSKSDFDCSDRQTCGEPSDTESELPAEDFRGWKQINIDGKRLTSKFSVDSFQHSNTHRVPIGGRSCPCDRSASVADTHVTMKAPSLPLPPTVSCPEVIDLCDDDDDCQVIELEQVPWKKFVSMAEKDKLFPSMYEVPNITTERKIKKSVRFGYTERTIPIENGKNRGIPERHSRCNDMPGVQDLDPCDSEGDGRGESENEPSAAPVSLAPGSGYGIGNRADVLLEASVSQLRDLLLNGFQLSEVGRCSLVTARHLLRKLVKETNGQSARDARAKDLMLGVYMALSHALTSVKEASSWTKAEIQIEKVDQICLDSRSTWPDGQNSLGLLPRFGDPLSEGPLSPVPPLMPLQSASIVYGRAHVRKPFGVHFNPHALPERIFSVDLRNERRDCPSQCFALGRVNFTMSELESACEGKRKTWCHLTKDIPATDSLHSSRICLLIRLVPVDRDYSQNKRAENADRLNSAFSKILELNGFLQRSGYAEATQFPLEWPACDGRTLLHGAVELACEQSAKRFLRAGARPDGWDRKSSMGGLMERKSKSESPISVALALYQSTKAAIDNAPTCDGAILARLEEIKAVWKLLKQYEMSHRP
jgi:hypothetical protein